MKRATKFLVMLSVLGLAGCSQQEEGAAEKAGKQVDEALEKAQTYTSEKMKEAGEAMQKAGEDLEKK